MPVFVGLWQVCVGDGTLMRYVQRMTGYVSVLALPHLRGVLGLAFRVRQAETDPREPYVLPSGTSLWLAQLWRRSGHRPLLGTIGCEI
jgi:hypothetical protein